MLYPSLVDDRSLVTDQELGALQIVRPDSTIAECQGFDYFLIE